MGASIDGLARTKGRRAWNRIVGHRTFVAAALFFRASRSATSGNAHRSSRISVPQQLVRGFDLLPIFFGGDFQSVVLFAQRSEFGLLLSSHVSDRLMVQPICCCRDDHCGQENRRKLIFEFKPHVGGGVELMLSADD